MRYKRPQNKLYAIAMVWPLVIVTRAFVSLVVHWPYWILIFTSAPKVMFKPSLSVVDITFGAEDGAPDSLPEGLDQGSKLLGNPET